MAAGALGVSFSFYDRNHDRSLLLNIDAAPWLEANDWLEDDEDLRYQESRIHPAAGTERGTPIDTSTDRYHDTMNVRLHTARGAGKEAPEAVGEPFGTWRPEPPGRAGKKLTSRPVLATNAAGLEVLVNHHGIVLVLE